MSAVEIGPKLEFHPSGRVQEIISDKNISEEQKRTLIASLGPDAGVFAPKEEPEAK